MDSENLELSAMDRLRVAEAGMIIAQDRYCEMEASLQGMINLVKRLFDIVERQTEIINQLERRVSALEAGD